jgi:hypothetical protein
MNTEDRVTQSIEVSHFSQIVLHAINVENEVVIKPGERETLTIEACPDVFAKIKTETQDGQLNIRMGGSWPEKIRAALATSLTRPQIKYTFTVKKLTDLQITGVAHVDVANIETDRLTVRFSGLGDMNIDALKAERLDIEQPMPGACRINASGRVTEQHVSLRGMSEYSVDRLESKRATVALKGPGGHAVIRVDDELDVAVTGPGSVEYYGHPRVTKKISPMGVVTQLLDVEKVAAQGVRENEYQPRA